MREPQIGDRVFMSYGCQHGSDEGVVMGRRDSDWGPAWTVQIKDGGIAYIHRYIGTAEDRGGYLVPSKQEIGTYVVQR